MSEPKMQMCAICGAELGVYERDENTPEICGRMVCHTRLKCRFPSAAKAILELAEFAHKTTSE